MKERATIIAVKNGIPQGYIQSVSYVKKNFIVTKNKAQAKGYVKQDRLHKEIDFLTSIAYQNGYTFMYN